MNENDEAQYVAAQILADFSRGRHWKDHAVLYRMNAQSNQLEQAFKRNGIPYRIIGGTRFFDRAEVKDMLAYLCVHQQPRRTTCACSGSSTTRPGASAPRRVDRAQAHRRGQEGRSLYEVICQRPGPIRSSRSAAAKLAAVLRT